LQIYQNIYCGGDVCDCCFGEQLDNKKHFRPLYIFKHMLKNNIEEHFLPYFYLMKGEATIKIELVANLSV
jgi:hypothetical protein